MLHAHTKRTRDTGSEQTLPLVPIDDPELCKEAAKALGQLDNLNDTVLMSPKCRNSAEMCESYKQETEDAIKFICGDRKQELDNNEMG